MNSVSLGRVNCKIRVNHRLIGEQLLRAPVINAKKIKAALALGMPELASDEHQAILLNRLVLNLGTLSHPHVETQFYVRLQQAFAAALLRALQPTATNRDGVPTITSGLQPVAHQPAPTAARDSRHLLACRCLQARDLRAVMHRRPSTELQQWYQQLLPANTSAQVALPAAADHRVTESRLALSALHHLLGSAQGQRWLRQHRPHATQLQRWAQAIICGEVAARTVLQLLLPRPSPLSMCVSLSCLRYHRRPAPHSG